MAQTVSHYCCTLLYDVSLLPLSLRTTYSVVQLSWYSMFVIPESAGMAFESHQCFANTCNITGRSHILRTLYIHYWPG